MTTLKRIVYLLLCITQYCLGEEYRLPDTVTPTFYNLYLNINPDSDKYTGIVNITFQTSNVTKDIYIHSDQKYINISSVILNNNANCYVNDIDVNDVLLISCSRALLLDEDNAIYIEFSSKFSENGYGMFKTTYAEGSNKQIIIESNFKPTYARRAFPCLDEPAFKAGFSIEVTHPKEYSVLSNSPATDTSDVSDDLQKTKFEDTPKISTYLLSIFISKFQETDTSAVDGVDFKIFTRAEATSLTKAVANAYYKPIIEKLDSYIGVNYENLNDTESYLVAVPDYNDAMGDFGLFAYRETELLDEGNKTTNRAKQNIISTMAYKLSHEWYGGSVATKWWSDVWANEAIATYMKYSIPDQVDEELELTNQFLLEVTQNMLQNDAYSFAQPLSSKESDINDKWLIRDKLNTANYEKGSSLLQTFSLITGSKENFQSALQNHFKNRMGSETDGLNILEDILNEIQFDIDYTYLQNWIYSPGYPLVTVQLQESDNVTDIANMTQKRFLYLTEDQVEDNSVWYVPLTSASYNSDLSDIRVGVFLAPEEHMMYLFDHDLWLMINTHGGCFYRVNYDETMWRRILNGMSANKDDFHVLQRSQVLDDIFSIARIGDVDYSLAFEMADLLSNETSYYPWYSALNAFSYMLGKLEDKEVEWNLKNYILNLMENIIEIPSDSFVKDNDTHIDVLRKVMILDWACYLGHAECIEYAIEKFNQYKDSHLRLDDYNARGVIFCNGIRHSENIEMDWIILWDTYSTSLFVHEQDDILKALGCAENKELLLSYLQTIITTDSGLKRQDTLVVFKSVLSSSLGLEVAMEFLENNMAEIENFFSDMRVLAEMIYAVAEKLVSDDHVNWLQNLLKSAVLVNFVEVRTKAITLASVNNYWKKNFRSGIIDKFPPSSTEPSPDTSSIEPVTTEETPTTPDSKGYIISMSKHSSLFIVMTFTMLLLNK